MNVCVMLEQEPDQRVRSMSDAQALVRNCKTWARLPTWDIENLIMRILLSGFQFVKSRVWSCAYFLSGCLFDKSRIWSCPYFCLVANLTNREFGHAGLWSGCQIDKSRFWSWACFLPGCQFDNSRIESCVYFFQAANSTNREFDNVHTFSGCQRTHTVPYVYPPSCKVTARSSS